MVKVAVLGEHGVGKTSSITHAITGHLGHMSPTKGIKRVSCNIDGNSVKFQEFGRDSDPESLSECDGAITLARNQEEVTKYMRQVVRYGEVIPMIVVKCQDFDLSDRYTSKPTFEKALEWMIEMYYK